MEKVFKKLVRNKIPKIILNSGYEPVIKYLNDEEYLAELYKKLLEESNEVITSKNIEETLEELADLLEVIASIAKLKNKNLEDILAIANEKRINRGGFENRIFLEKINNKNS